VIFTEQKDRDLEVLLSFLLNRQLKQAELIMALGISRSAFYDQRERGVLCSPNNLIAVARYFGINPVQLLVVYGHLELGDVLNFVQDGDDNRSRYASSPL